MQSQEHRNTMTGRFALAVVGLVGLSLLIAVMMHPAPAQARSQAEPGAELYASNCSACHQADGQGIPGMFPPLAGNPAAADGEYVTTVINEGLSGPIEVLGETYDAVMPPITALDNDADTAAVVAYVAGLAGVSGEPSAAPAPAEPPTTGDVDRGHDWFVGSDRLDAGGPACAACHTAGSVGNLGGSGLGPDLTDVFTTFGGEPGLTAWLGNPPSQTMAPIFGDQPLNGAEIADLVAFLADAPQQDKPSNSVDGLLLGAIGGLAILLGGMAIAWRGMRQTYVEKLRTKQ